MKNKNIFLESIIRNIIIVVILFLIFFRNTSEIKILIIPFITCGLFSLVKNICYLINKDKYAKIFSKLFIISFLIFWFGFLVFWSYLVIKENNYWILLFTIPFWVAGIYIARKYLFKVKKKTQPKSKKTIFNFKNIVSGFLVTTILLIGIVCLSIGIKETYKINKISKDYLKTDGYLVDYEIYSPNSKSKTYKLTYVYEVDKNKYTVSTDYGVSTIPEKGSIRKVKYNPHNPEKSLLIGTNSKNGFIYFGSFFTLGALAFILGALSVKGIFDKIKTDIIGLYLGFVFLIVGIGFIIFQNGTTASLLETIKSLGIWIILPLLFILVGIFQIIKCLFFKTPFADKK